MTLLCRHANAAQLFFLSLLLLHTAAQDLFLFSGQSNMLGHPTSDQAIEPGRMLFEDTLRLDGSELIDRIDKAQSNALATPPEHDSQTAVRTAQAISELKERGVLAGVLTPLPTAYCVWNDGALRPIEAYAGCGSEFGPELTFAHSLQQQASSFYATSQQPLHVRKAAVGGKIVTDFLPGGDTHQLLLDVLDDGITSGIYRAFVWYQGENDFFAGTSTQEYVDNFMTLVNLVTARMYDHGATASAFASSTEIPIIVVKLGYWPGGPGTPQRTNIDQAHEDVVAQLLSEGRPAATVEELDQYSRFFHLDPATYLIAGDSIAQAYLNLAPVDESSSPTTPMSPTTPSSPTACGIFCLIRAFIEWMLSLFPFF